MDNANIAMSTQGWNAIENGIVDALCRRRAADFTNTQC